MQILNDLTPLAATTIRQLAEKRTAVQANIVRLENALEQWKEQIDGLVDAHDAYSLSQTLLQEKAAYAEVPEAEIIDALLTRCRAVERALRLIEKEKTTPLQSPDEALSRQLKLKEAQADYATQLTSIQNERLNQTQIRLDTLCVYNR